jgi:3-oxoacyl-[acyl-carrier protein] reductase
LDRLSSAHTFHRQAIHWSQKSHQIYCRESYLPQKVSLSARGSTAPPQRSVLRHSPHNCFRPAQTSRLGQAPVMGLAFVTGASRGLGREVARALKSAGHEVIGISKDSQRAATASNDLGFPFETVDFEDIGATRTLAQSLLEKYGTPQILVLAHGVMSDKMAKTLRTNDQEWARVMNINLNSVFTLVNAIGAPMAEARNGRIIIFSACLGRMSGPGNAGGLAPYRISKAGVNAMVRNLAHETGHGSRGLLVDAICPNHSRTDMGGPDAPRSAEEGAATAIWLATREFNPGDKTGLFWEDQEVIEW